MSDAPKQPSPKPAQHTGPSKIPPGPLRRVIKGWGVPKELKSKG